jgi:hypothetical protein
MALVAAVENCRQVSRAAAPAAIGLSEKARRFPQFAGLVIGLRAAKVAATGGGEIIR